MVLNNVAYFYIDTLNGRYPEAIGMAERAVKLRPNEGAFWDTLGWGYYKIGQLDRAVTAQRRAVALASDNPEVRTHLGAIYEAQGNRDAAAAEYRAALKLDPEFAPARESQRRLDR
jgi:Flp pilus assembly protein TadD